MLIKTTISQGLYCASKEDQEISKTIFVKLMGQQNVKISTPKVNGIKKREDEQTNTTTLHCGNEENEGWKIVSYLKERKNKQKK